MIPLFSRYALDRPQVEERLGRPLGGDPSRGERAALLALVVLDYDRCRQHLDDPGVGADFRALVEERLQQSIRRSGRHFVVTTLVDGHAYDHYARQARLQGVQVATTIAAAIERDFATARGLHQVEAEPVLPVLVGYLRALIELLRKTDTDPDFAAKLAQLVDLHGRLTSALGEAAPNTGGTT